MSTCGVCKAVLSSESALARHQTSAQYCLEQQKVQFKKTSSKVKFASESESEPEEIYTPTVPARWVEKTKSIPPSGTDFKEIAKAVFASAVLEYAAKNNFKALYSQSQVSPFLSATQKKMFADILQKLVKDGETRIQKVLEEAKYREVSSTAIPGKDPWILINTPQKLMGAINNYYAMYHLGGLSVLTNLLKGMGVKESCEGRKVTDCSDPCSLTSGPLGIIRKCRFLTEEEKRSGKYKLVPPKSK